ncbi:uncharacterized protein LOC124444014 isoform X3 [Xenia sp. Carnegie-2017]|uniref:uncharacterized protein LOC124444014 isoform X3 n=1 Tax=Xenia sp. Carnegie-2017 TaxID=2897299 RepID=UPI001F050198|nr:uncharacterized protein LOC124444014 isoform X3 [Xenia sp. Carnegie-2017]XP_046850538.1 uncharacterized protein LOC124444014 isoform X3 [Xenia sp. Carnegie-2017]
MNVYKQLVPAYFIPREWIYVELLRCLEKSKQPRVAIDLYNDMKQHRVSMTFNTCRSFMSCFSVKLGKEQLPEYVRIMEEIIQWAAFFDIETDDFMKSQMIRIYCLNGQYERAWECMEKFSQNKFEPSFVALSSLLHGTIVRNNKADAMKILKMIAEKGFVLNVKSRNTYYRHLEFTANESYEIDQLFVHRPNRVSSQRK